MPFALDVPPAERINSVEYLSGHSMAVQDRQAVARARALIWTKAVRAGFDLDKGKWTYQQIVCPVLPRHILLFYSRNRGVDDVSEFSAILLRNSNAAVRILPILHRSYALFPPAPVNPISISDFNLLRAQDNPGKKVDWLTTSLCYAALTGAHVVLPRQAASHSDVDVPLGMNPLLQIAVDGSATVRIDDLEAPQRPKEWKLSFDKNGNLLHVAVIAVAPLKVTPLP